MPTHLAMWAALPGEADVLIVGGGIVGSGIARDAARRGLRVALLEMNDLASATSSRSSKLVHGGLRYLESYEFSLVFESVSERRVLMDLAPHLVNPLGFLFPVYDGSKPGLFVLKAGMWLYDGLSLFRSPKTHRTLRPKDVAELEPAVRQEGLRGAPLYYDCSTDDARLTIETAMDAAQAGAIVSTWSRVESFLKDENGRVCGAVVRHDCTGELKEIRAHAIVNATGPWTDRTRALSQTPEGGKLLRPTKGAHVVFDAAKLPVRHAVVCMHPEDGRVLFVIPWGEQVYVGTTDTDFDGDPAEVVATRADVDYLLAACAAYFPSHPVGHDDVIATWAALRPLIAPERDDGEIEESRVSREHQIIIGRDGIITIAGGKLTTYRRMAAEVVDTVANFLRLARKLPKDLHDAATDRDPLPGGVAWPDDDDHEAVAARVLEAGKGKLGAATARYLTDTYGMRAFEIVALAVSEPDLAAAIMPGRAEIMAQVDYGVHEELAATVSDVLMRRTQIFFRDREQGLGAVERVGARMAVLLGWDDAYRRRVEDAYRREVELSRRWRLET